MAYFTAENTDGTFSADELSALNAAHRVLVDHSMAEYTPTPDRAQVEKAEADALNNAWRPSCWTARDLVVAVMEQSRRNAHR